MSAIAESSAEAPTSIGATNVSASLPLDLPQTHYDTSDAWLAKLLGGTPLTESEIVDLAERARAVLIGESNVQPVRGPCTVCGDVHGQGSAQVIFFLLSFSFPAFLPFSQSCRCRRTRYALLAH